MSLPDPETLLEMMLLFGRTDSVPFCVAFHGVVVVEGLVNSLSSYLLSSLVFPPRVFASLVFPSRVIALTRARMLTIAARARGPTAAK